MNLNTGQNFQNQNMNGNVKRNFLETHYLTPNNWNQTGIQNQQMSQMMQNMMETMTRMESKMIQLEMERRILNYR